MAGTSLLTLIDDIATALDDIAMMTKVATKKTAGVLGDDLALNAKQVIGVHADRELPVVWAVAKGSAVNKLILIPLALLISYFVPILVTVLLMAGGLYLCYEGFEKIMHSTHNKNLDLEKLEVLRNNPCLEKEKIKGAVRTDFVLSAEIVVITLGSVAKTTILNQIIILSLISSIMTVGVYGLVACIVKLDDLGLMLSEKRNLAKKVGILLIGAAPLLMSFLSIAGTIAMFLVGGNILVHGIPYIHHYTNQMSFIFSLGIDLILGIFAGGIMVSLVSLVSLFKSAPPNNLE